MVEHIPQPMYEELSERLLDALLETKEGGNVPSSLAKALLHQAQREQLASDIGLSILLEALALADLEKVVAILDEFKLEKVKLGLKSLID